MKNFGNINVYNGWPWGDTKATLVDMDVFSDVLMDDAAKFINCNPGDFFVYNSPKWYANSDWACKKTDVVDGINCIGLVQHPIWADKDWYEKSWSSKSDKKKQ